MVLPLDDVYQKISGFLVAEIGDNFKTININFKLFGESSFSVDGSYIDQNDTERFFDVPNSIIEVIYEIYFKMAVVPQGKWRSMVFQLKPDGQFKVEFSY